MVCPDVVFRKKKSSGIEEDADVLAPLPQISALALTELPTEEKEKPIINNDESTTPGWDSLVH